VINNTGITGTLREEVDKLWLEFHVGGITNPLTVIEQITYLIFCRLLDQAEAMKERRALKLKKPYRSIYDDVLQQKDEHLGGTRSYSASRTGRYMASRSGSRSTETEEREYVRWSAFSKIEDAERMLKVVRDTVFPFLRKLGESSDRSMGAGQYLKDATLMIVSPSLLYRAVGTISRLPLEGDRKGDLYEYVLSKLSTAGINGQFRTPRHVIQLMVDLLDPRPDQTIGDPSCGTGGFLVGVMEYLYRKYTSKAGIVREPDPDAPEGKRTIYTGDLLEPYMDHIRNRMLYGFDFDITMLRIGAMNLMLHGLDSPNVYYQNSLSGSFFEKYPEQARNAFDAILANPPFAGNVDDNDIEPTLTRLTKTRKTELLFLALILRMLKPAGRAAVIVPHGVLFGGSKAHLSLRKHLLDDNQVEAVISLPGGVFKPYAGVATAILLFTKSGRTEEVWFYDVQSDGRSLDDKRTPLDDHDGDLKDVRERWAERDKRKLNDRTAKCFIVPAQEIREASYDLTVGRYRQARHEELKYESPKKIIGKLQTLEQEIVSGLKALEARL
jgi:type I restriction enzyme M protein